MQLIEQVRRAIRRHDLVRPGMRVLVALSGGSDSVCLTHLCRDLHGAGDFVLAGVAHLNHRLREDADSDAAFCAELAARMDLPMESEAADVGALARQRGVSIETAAHDARYAFLRDAARRLSADRVALGHTLDDQAETVLLRLLRGAGARGLAGMYPRHGIFIRPLLPCRRDDLRAWLIDRRLAFRDDPTNQDCTIPRNRLRHELIPRLARDFNPRVVHVLGQQAELARDEWDWIDQAAAGLVARVAREQVDGWVIDVAGIQAAHPALARAAVRRLLERAAGGRPIALPHVQRALELFTPQARGAADFPGQRLERRGDAIVLTGRPPLRRVTGSVESRLGFRYSLSIPGETRIPEASATLIADLRPGGVRAGEDAAIPPHGAGQAAIIGLSALPEAGWAVRSRQAGDRISWPGLGGRKKVHDLFIDRKVPRAERDRVPVVVDAQDRIVWVAGHAVAGEFRVTDPAQAVVVLRLKLWGGSA